MPNWVAAGIKLKGPADEVKKFHARCEENDGFSFNLFIPMSKELEIEENKAAAVFVWDSNHPFEDDYPSAELKAALDLIFPWDETLRQGKLAYEKLGEQPNPPKHPDMMTQERFVEQGVRTLENIKKYGFCSWYNWCIANWGTKWDVDECNMFKPVIDPDSGEAEMELYFNTAWSFPEAAIRTISTQYPDITFSGHYADEDIGNNCGTFTAKAGVVDITDRSGDIAFANEIWGYDNEEEDS